MKNLRFNRMEKRGRCIYIDDFTGMRKFEEFEYEGFIKCKLVHNVGYSVVCPDQIYFNSADTTYWIQPLYFSGNHIAQFEEYGLCDFGVDISFGACLRIRFKDSDAVSWLEDGSILYRCTIKGPKYLYQYRTGPAKIEDGIPYIKLYHHTSKSAKDAIESGQQYWSSNWNIQGTKKSTNIGYLYLTSLPKISTIDDLTQIAMSSHGRLAFRVDSNFTSKPDLILEVYRDSTDNRTHTLSHWVNASLLAPQPCYRHLPPDGFGYHAIVSPFIHRIGVEPNTNVQIDGKFLSPHSLKMMGYAVVGDATKISGLAAPFDEEDTEHKFMIEHINQPEEIIGFWMRNGNTNQVGNKVIEEVTFE